MNVLDQLVPYRPVPLIDDGSSNQRVLGVTEDGLEITVPCLPYEWWLDKEGSVVPVVISNSRCMPPEMAKTRDDQEASKSYEVRYEQHMRKTLKAAGWWRLDDYLTYVAPTRDEEGNPVTVSAKEVQPGARKKVEAELTARQAKAKARGKKYEDMAASNGQLIAEAIVKGNAKLIDQVTALGTRAERGK